MVAVFIHFYITMLYQPSSGHARLACVHVMALMDSTIQIKSLQKVSTWLSCILFALFLQWWWTVSLRP